MSALKIEMELGTKVQIWMSNGITETFVITSLPTKYNKTLREITLRAEKLPCSLPDTIIIKLPNKK